VLPHLNRSARISLCGLVSRAANYGNVGGNPRDAWLAAGRETFDARNVAVHDLFVGNFVASHQERFLREMADWIRAGRVKYKEDVWSGLERAPDAFRAMLEGGNFGKTLVAVADDPTQPQRATR
jgi:NADPH-dependent curcumin reductase CurA